MVTRLQETINPGKMIGNLKYFSKTETDRSETSYLITVETKPDHEIVTSPEIEDACSGRRLVMAEDVSVTRNLYETLDNGHMITMSQPHTGSEDQNTACDVSKIMDHDIVRICDVSKIMHHNIVIVCDVNKIMCHNIVIICDVSK